MFGVSSDEYLNYAMRNRGEWERSGQEAVEKMKAEIIAVQEDEKITLNGA